MNRLFVYGIFLGESLRPAFGMSNPRYETVPGFITVGGRIVEAIRVPNDEIALTGLVVDVDPVYWGRIDELESGYDRIIVQTSSNESVYMYAKRGTNGQE